MNNSPPVGPSSGQKSELGEGCHLQPMRQKYERPFWTLICDCCGSWSQSLEKPDGARACLTCLRHGHGPNWQEGR